MTFFGSSPDDLGTADTSKNPATAPSWSKVVQDVLRLYAPEATFLGQIEGRQVRISVQAVTSQEQQALEPPDEWLDSGVLDWVSADGHLLGLIWSPQGIGPAVTGVLNRLLAPRSTSACTTEFQLLLTQLPQPTLWLDMELTVLEASRSFLELFGLEREAVIGQSLPKLELPLELRTLEAAAQGRQLEEAAPEIQEVEDPRDPDQTLWLRPTVQSFYTGQQSGLLWTVQDITAARQQGEWLQTLLGGLGVPAAVINLSGEIQQANQSLIELSGLDSLLGERLQELAILSDAGQETVQNLMSLAAEGGAALAQIERRKGHPLTLELRRSPNRPELLVAQLSEGRVARSESVGDLSYSAGGEEQALLQKVLNQQHTATLLIDQHGILQLINDQAAQLAGADAARLLGKNIRKQLDLLGLRLLDDDEHTLQLSPWEYPLPYTAEILLETPTQGRRPMALSVTPVNPLNQTADSLLMVTLNDLSDLKRAQAQATYGAYHDQLTGLYNRAGLRKFLAGLEAPAGGVVSVLELDEYAALTTATEPTAIHHLLMQLAASFRSLAAAHGGEAARLGDGTFALWLPGLSGKRAQSAVEQVTQATFRVGKTSTNLTFAVGLAEVTQSLQPDLALGNAEIAAQAARRQGRGQTSPYRDELRTQLAETFRLEQSLRDSVSSGQLKLHYQPTLDLQSGTLSGAEALLRWERISTQLSPHELLDMAARLRLLQPLSDWVMREALQQQLAWNELWPDLRVGINVSLEELRQPAALGALWPMLERMQGQGRPRPSIEISAHTTLDFRAQDIKVLRQLDKAGAAIWLDQFGEGAMSLTSLTEFPLTGLKLHPQMVVGLRNGEQGSERSTDLVAATLTLAHQLGLRVTAVGVETAEQLDILTRLKCDKAQGYAISPPLKASALSDWLRAHPPGTPGAPTSEQAAANQ